MTKTVDLKIEGMADGGAAQSLIVALTALPGVVKADVSLMKRRARITYDPARTGIEAFRSAIVRAGYRAS